MGCANVIWMVVSPCAAHSFRFSVVWYDIVEICELFVADRALSALIYDFLVQQLAHLGR